MTIKKDDRYYVEYWVPGESIWRALPLGYKSERKACRVAKITNTAKKYVRIVRNGSRVRSFKDGIQTCG